MTYPHIDPNDMDALLDAADAIVNQPSFFFGRVTTNARWITLCREQGAWVKHEYDPDLYAKAEITQGMFNAVSGTINIGPHCDPTLQNWAREISMSNPKRREYLDVIAPSLEALAPMIATLKGKVVGQFKPFREVSELWVKGENVQNPDNKTGERYTTYKFHEVYADEAACRAAWEAWMNEQGRDIPGAPAAPAPIDPAVRVGLVPFLDHFWELSKGERLPLSTFLKHLQSETMAPGGFTLSDPECVALHGATTDGIALAESGEEVPF